MIYFGVDLRECGCSITALSEGFAVLDSKNFYTKFTAFSNKENKSGIDDENNNICNWADSLKCLDKEKTYWYFDECHFLYYLYNFDNFGLNKFFDEFFLVDHRRLINLHKFLNEFPAFNGNSFSVKFDMAHLLASSARLFNFTDIKPLKMENLAMLGKI